MYPITPPIMPLTYKAAAALYPDIKAMALYLEESFGNNFGKNGLIQAKLNSLNRENKNVYHMKWSPNSQWELGSMLQRMNARWLPSV